MATIRIERTNEFLNRMRNFTIYIDGEQAGTVANGETKDFTVTPGQHSVLAKIDWCTSPTLSINTGDTEIKKLKVGGFKIASPLIFTGLGILILHFLLSEIVQFNYVILLLIPVFLLLSYYLTLGRNKYLTIGETNDN